MDLLKGKETKEVELVRSSYGPLKTDSFLLDLVRVIEFNVEATRSYLYYAPKH